MTLRVRFFGKFQLAYSGLTVDSFKSQKSVELLAYLFYRRSAQSRDSLASLIWGEHVSMEQGRKYLRNALWQLQKDLTDLLPNGPEILDVDARSVGISPSLRVWTDVEQFESAYASVRDQDGGSLTDEQVATLREAVDLHDAAFLEGWFNDWCLLCRERAQHHALLMLDKLMSHAIIAGDYESAILFGERILAYDRAREITHRRLMEAQYLSGDRTAAIRQFKSCEEVLRKELDIGPSELTREVFESIRDDTYKP